MSSNVGLSTPRGSGTSGYVQRNSANLKPRTQPYPANGASADHDAPRHRPRQPDQDILSHERRREIEVKVFELRDRLEDEGEDEDGIDARCDALRKELLAKQERDGGGDSRKKGLKAHQVHELAAAKIEESERLRRALGIGADYEEGAHWRRREERRKEAEKEAEVEKR